MANYVKPFAFFLLCSLSLVVHATAFIALKTHAIDPELLQCKHQCKHQQAFDESQIQECNDRCEQFYKEKQAATSTSEDPMKQYAQCRRQCWRESDPDREHEQEVEEKCKHKCLEEMKEKQEEKEKGHDHQQNLHEKGQEKEDDDNPYVFEDKHFRTMLKTEHGKVRWLSKFSERSEFLNGVKYYSLAILETDPQTFVVPNHCDAEVVIFVAQGRGTISLICADKRESCNLKCGDILRIPAGTTVYLINRDKNEKLVIAKLMHPISTDRDIKAFVGVGGENPKSFFKAFSPELLEATFNTKRDRLEKLFQQKGAIIKASEEQIRAMSQHEEGGIWPFSESKGAVNLYQQHPIKTNEYGEFREVSPNDNKQLQNLNVGVSFANITKGAMETAHYNSKSTQICMVLKGEGYFEMACPHMVSSETSHGHEKHKGSQSQGQKGEQNYKRVNARLRRGMVVIVPTGHPIIMAASKNQNLEVVCFETNANDNERIPLAGRNNMWNQMEREAKELAFGVASREVDEILSSQEEEWFFKGPSELPQQQEGLADE